ncbi:uncharacterized protein UV8b_00247 [Ustilaginoidea virens]|uniref:Uncharacterized protein n=1 Tax=Ustilaginoidea virens TaxID=1159556 RepID=A0A063BYB2_USTVR|nr:uncharacterized protein UV8b_00247 [Ustilaginoidea virens]QUC16006.1 hypothetical protein UV8b_00247 [Ustilaginoidea virens]GAO16394.1 hypothetical protein UVI_02049530 [Ustilaginoidea virens]
MAWLPARDAGIILALFVLFLVADFVFCMFLATMYNRAAFAAKACRRRFQEWRERRAGGPRAQMDDGYSQSGHLEDGKAVPMPCVDGISLASEEGKGAWGDDKQILVPTACHVRE